MEKVKRFVKTSFVYFIGQVLSKLVAVFLLPLYTNELLPEQLGNYDIAVTMLNLIVPIVFMQIWDGTFRFAFDDKYENKKHFLLNNSLVVFAIGIIPCIALLYLSCMVFNLNHKVLIIAYGLLYCLQYIYTFSARMYLNNKLFVFSGVTCSVTNALVNIILMKCFGMGLESLYISQIIGCLIQILLIEIRIKTAGKFDIHDTDWKCIGDMLRFTIPLCISTASYWMLTGFTKIIINKGLGEYENGIYAVASKFSMLTTFVSTILQYAWNETVYIALQEKEEKQDYSEVINIFLKLMIYACIGLCLFIKLFFPLLVGESYIESIYIIPAVMIGACINVVATLLNPLFMADKKTGIIMVSTLVGAALNTILCVASLHRFGLQGISVSLAIAFLIVLLIRLFELKKKYDMKYDKTIIADLLILTGFTIGYYKVNTIFGIIMMIVAAIAVMMLSCRKYIFQAAKIIQNK